MFSKQAAITCAGGLSNSCNERVVTRVKVHGEGAVDDASIDLGAKVQLHNIIILQHCLVPCRSQIIASHQALRCSAIAPA